MKLQKLTYLVVALTFIFGSCENNENDIRPVSDNKTDNLESILGSYSDVKTSFEYKNKRELEIPISSLSITRENNNSILLYIRDFENNGFENMIKLIPENININSDKIEITASQADFASYQFGNEIQDIISCKNIKITYNIREQIVETKITLRDEKSNTLKELTLVSTGTKDKISKEMGSWKKSSFTTTFSQKRSNNNTPTPDTSGKTFAEEGWGIKLKGNTFFAKLAERTLNPIGYHPVIITDLDNNKKKLTVKEFVKGSMPMKLSLNIDFNNLPVPTGTGGTIRVEKVPTTIIPDFILSFIGFNLSEGLSSSTAHFTTKSTYDASTGYYEFHVKLNLPLDFTAIITNNPDIRITNFNNFKNY